MLTVWLLVRLWRWLSGSLEVGVSQADLIPAVTVMMRRSVPYRDLKLTENGAVFTVPRRGYRELTRAAGGALPSLTVLREAGLPGLVFRYRRRPGIAVGALLFFLLCALSERFLWEVDVTGNDAISDVEVTETLAALGCSIGSPIGGIDFFSLPDAYLAVEPRAAWVSVNREGTTAHVVILEKKEKGEAGIPERSALSPSNLVAAEHGVIVSVEIVSGQAQVRAGDTVEKGQLLVSGTVGKKGDPAGVTHLERSAGRVLAACERTVTVRVPLTREETVVTGERTVEKTVIFFGKPIKISKTSRNSGPMYGIIEENDRLVLFGFLRLPVFVRTVTEVTYFTRTVTLTEEETAEEGERALNRAILRETGDAELLGRTDTVTREEDALVLTSVLRLIADVAEERQITLIS